MATTTLTGNVLDGASEPFPLGHIEAAWLSSTEPWIPGDGIGINHYGNGKPIDFDPITGDFTLSGIPASSAGAPGYTFHMKVHSRPMERGGRLISIGPFLMDVDKTLKEAALDLWNPVAIDEAVRLDIAAAAALGDNNDTMTASFLNDTTPSATRTAAEGLVDDVTGRTHATAYAVSALQAAIDATPAGGVLVLDPRATYTLAAPLVINKALTLDGGGASITRTGAGHGIQVQASDVRLRDFTLTSDQGAIYQSSDGIRVEGTEAAIITGFRMTDVDLRDWPMRALYMQSATYFRILRCTAKNIGYAGMQTLACRDGSFLNCEVDTITAPSPYSQGYGIALTRDQTATLALSPRSARIRVDGCTIRNMSTGGPTGLGWEGIDTHGGEKLTITRNEVYNCYTGIAMVPCPDTTGVDIYAPIDIVITDNIVDSQRTNATSRSGIQLVGAYDTGAAAVKQYATGIIANNTVIDCGEDISSSGGIFMQVTRGVRVANNRIIRPTVSGVHLWYRNQKVSVVNNYVEDAWSDALVFTAGVYSRSDNNTGSISGNVVGRAGKTATVINDRGVYIGSTVGGSWKLSGNDFTACTTPVSGGAAVISGSTMAGVMETVAAAPTATQLRTALVNLGLVNP